MDSFLDFYDISKVYKKNCLNFDQDDSGILFFFDVKDGFW